jgi:hypothetical protein
MSVYVDEYAPAVVHELTEREGAETRVAYLERPLAREVRLEVAPGLDPLANSRSVSVVCRLCHGDLDESLFCSLCGVVTFP